MERQSYFKDLWFSMQCMNPVKGLRDIGVRRYWFLIQGRLQHTKYSGAAL